MRAWEIRDSPGKGRGLFAARFIWAGEEICAGPTIIAPLGAFDGSPVESHATENDGEAVLVLSPHSLCNHDDTPNCECRPDETTDSLVSLRCIAEGEELTLDYAACCDWFKREGPDWI